MKAILEFELPQESEEHNLALNGGLYKSIIDDTFSWIRKKEKYDETLTEDQYKILDELREFIANELK